MKIPKKLKKCPLVDFIFEIRFDPIVPREVVFPMIYSKISEDFEPIEALPISQMPAQVRDGDPNLKYSPLFRLKSKVNKNHIIQIGPNVVAWSSSPLYTGWDNFKNFVQPLIKVVFECGVFNSIARVGFRGVNFFEGDIYDGKLNMVVSLGETEIPYHDTHLRTEFREGDYATTVQLINGAEINLPTAKKQGSVIDLDTFCIKPSLSYEEVVGRLDVSHDIEKKVFYTLLKPEFIESLEPEY